MSAFWNQKDNGVTVSWRCHAHLAQKTFFVNFYGRVEGFWLCGFYNISRRQILNYIHFQGIKLKLRSRAFCWVMICFNTSIGSFTILKLAWFSFCLLYPVSVILIVKILLLFVAFLEKKNLYNLIYFFFQVPTIRIQKPFKSLFWTQENLVNIWFNKKSKSLVRFIV